MESGARIGSCIRRHFRHYLLDLGHREDRRAGHHPRPVVPELRKRIEAAKLCRQTDNSHSMTFFVDDAGCVREQIRAITGHTIASINEVLDRYTKLTADQPGAALAKRLAHEGQSQESTVSAFVRR